MSTYSIFLFLYGAIKNLLQWSKDKGNDGA